MEAKELMIGDWVLWNSPQGKRPVKLSDWIRIAMEASKCEPIPLTPEILTKNGWECLPDEPLYDWWSWRHNGCMLYLNLCGDTAEIEIFGRELYIHYVHELQHALRLCGLTELADNFKV